MPGVVGTVAKGPNIYHPLHRGAICTENWVTGKRGAMRIFGKRAFQAESKAKADAGRWEPCGRVEGDWPPGWSRDRVRGGEGGSEGQWWGMVRQQALCLTLFTGLNNVPPKFMSPRTS